MVSYSKFIHNNSNSEYRYNEPLSKDYRVFVNGNEIPVYTCRISKIPFNRAWPGHQREINQSEAASFVNIVSDEKINVEVIVGRKYKKLMLRPYSKDIAFTDENGRVSFELNEEGQLVLAADDFHGCLYIFNSKPVKCDNPDEVTYYFGPGIHMPGKIALKSNESVYVDKDALVFGCVFAEGAENIRIFGNGLLDDSSEERFCVSCYADYTNGNLKFYDCKNVTVQGVLMRNSAIWCVNVFHCFDVELDNIKVFGQWRYNTDGVDIVNSQNITVKNSFVHSFDDTITIKAIDRYITTNNENILTENCVLWCDWGKALELGFETACREYKNITFRNCDILRAGNTALDIQNGDCAEISGILYENINVEYNSFDNVPVMQENDDSVYDGYGKIMIPHFIQFANYRFRNEFYCDDIWGIPKEMAPLDLTGIKQYTIHDVTIKNINIYFDENIPMSGDKYPIPLEITSMFDDVTHYNISVSDVKINGKSVGCEDFEADVSGAKDFSFEKPNEFLQMKKNTVSSANQLKNSSSIRFVNPEGTGIRVMFAGNSITLHAPKEDIGWSGEWGMAASSPENDYVHIIMDEVKKSQPDAAFCICQVADWERDYKNGTQLHKSYEDARRFDADIIICRFIENCPPADFDENAFKKEYDAFVDFLNASGKAKIIISTGFWHHPGDEALRTLAKDNNYPLTELGDLGESDEMKAVGLFEHSGVASHPGDRGMREIAERIIKNMTLI